MTVYLKEGEEWNPELPLYLVNTKSLLVQSLRRLGITSVWAKCFAPSNPFIYIDGTRLGPDAPLLQVSEPDLREAGVPFDLNTDDNETPVPLYQHIAAFSKQAAESYCKDGDWSLTISVEEERVSITYIVFQERVVEF